MYTYSYKHYRKRLQSQTDDDVLIREPSSYDDSNRTTSPLPHPNDENYLKSVSSRKINDDDDDVYVVVSRPLRRRRQREMSIMQQQQEQFVDHDNDDDEHDPTGNFGATANAFSSLEALLLTEPSHGHQQDYQANTATSTCLEITSAATTTTTTTTRSLESVGEPTHRGADDGFFSHGNITCDVEAGVGGDFPLSPSRIVPAMSQQQTVTTTIRREAPLPAKPAHHAIEGCTKRTEKLDMSINLRRKVRENNTLRQKLSAVTNQNAVLTDNSSQRHSINDHPTMKKKLATTVTRAAKSIVGSRYVRDSSSK